MSLSHVLLTSLLEKPSTGIELGRRFDRSMGFFWNATHQQIYRELNAMLQKGWISTIEDEDSGSRKKTYQVERPGREELANWMLEQSPPAQLREELMVRLRAEAQMGSNTILPELERHLELHREKLNIYRQIFAKDFANPSKPVCLDSRLNAFNIFTVKITFVVTIRYRTWVIRICTFAMSGNK